MSLFTGLLVAMLAMAEPKATPAVRLLVLVVMMFCLW